MSRATWFYILIAVFMAAVLCVVFAAGSRLTAPRDLTGVWQVQGDASEAGPLTIEQSGVFVHIRFGKRDYDLRMSKALPGASPAAAGVIRIADGRNSLALTPRAGSARYDARWTDQTGEHSFSLAPMTASVATEQPVGSHAKTWLSRAMDDQVLRLLAQVGLVLLLSRAMGMLFARLHQPQVMGEMVAGIMLGPSLFGALFPQASGAIFPAAGIAGLSVLSQVGVIFFLFLIGLELDPKLIRNRGHAAVVISHVSIIAPFVFGAALTLALYSSLFNQNMRFLAVALFMGAAMSITAFPVLARILTERNLQKTKVGAVTITCAAVDDVTAWCLLAFVVAVARAAGPKPALFTAAASGLYVLSMFFVVRPLLARLQIVYDRQDRLSQNVVATVLLLVLASAYATEAIGIHALFGAFLLGAIMPKGTQFVRALSEKLEDFAVVFLLPLFFAFTGLKTQIGLLNSPALWLATGAIILVACAGKFGGSTVAARVCGLGWRESAAIGVLMNTRGLMELVILNMGRELGVITPAVFAMMVIMALVTTALTTPLLKLVYPRRMFDEPVVQQEAAREFCVLVPVAAPQSAAKLVRLANALSGASGPDRRIIALHLRRPVDREAYRSGLQEPTALEEPLRAVVEDAAAQHIPVEAISTVTRDVAADISRIAAAQHADLVLMGYHKPVLGKTILGGTVHRVLENAASDVAVFVDRGFEGARKVLVPYLGGRHDRFALELAGRLARSADAQIIALHVVPPQRDSAAALDARGVVERTFSEPGLSSGFQLRVVRSDSPVDAVLDASRDCDLLVIGVAEEWGLKSNLFGWKPQRIAESSTCSLLIVRKGEAPARVAAASAPLLAGASLAAPMP